MKERTLNGLVDEVAAPQLDEDRRRKFYRVTAVGREVRKAEASRYAHIVEVARRQQVLPEDR